MDRQPGLINRRAPVAPANRPRHGTGPAGQRARAGPRTHRRPRLRAAVLGVLAELEPGATPSVDEILIALHWRAPRRSPWQPGNPDSTATDPVRWTLDEAAQLGLIGLGGLTTYGRLLLERGARGRRRATATTIRSASGAATAASAAVAALDKLLPAPVDHVLIQADLSVIVPGPPEPGLAAELALVAEPESAGGASVYRVTPERIRDALDSGYSAAELQKLFTQRSRTGVPQALSYMIDDTARRHGGLRLGCGGLLSPQRRRRAAGRDPGRQAAGRPVPAYARADRPGLRLSGGPGARIAAFGRVRTGAGGFGRRRRTR